MEIDKAILALESEGFEVHSIFPCSAGVSHYNFDVWLSDDSEQQRYVARFESDLGKSAGRRIDTIYGGTMSLEREAALCRLVRQKAELPAPEINGPYNNSEPFILAEYMPGQLWGEYIQQQNYSGAVFLNSLELLGRDVGKAHLVTFDSFGDVMGNYVDNAVDTFSTRLEQVIQRNLQNNGDKYSEKERKKVEKYFRSTLTELRRATEKEKPVLVLADLHSTNFMVDSTGKPSGYFDLEFCQAASPGMEMYNISLQLFSLFNQDVFVEARNSFLKGYNSSSGGGSLEYDPHELKNQKVEEILTANHFFRAAAVYKQFTEGPRVGWADKFKEILFNIIDDGIIDYVGFKNTVRPHFPQQQSRP